MQVFLKFCILEYILTESLTLNFTFRYQILQQRKYSNKGGQFTVYETVWTVSAAFSFLSILYQ